MSASIPSVVQPPSTDNAKCPVCGDAVAFIAPRADLSIRFVDMTETCREAHDDHCAQNHPNEPVWNTLPKRSNVRIVSVEGFIQYTLDLAAETLEWNPVTDTSWEHTKCHLYRRLACARSLTDDPKNVLRKTPDFISNKETELVWKRWIKESTNIFLTSLMDIVFTSQEPEQWETPSLSRLQNEIQLFFLNAGCYCTSRLIDNTLIPIVPQWQDAMDSIKDVSNRKRGRKKMTGFEIKPKRQKHVESSESDANVNNEHIEMPVPDDADMPVLGVRDVVRCRPGIRASLPGSSVREGTVVAINAVGRVIEIHPFGFFDKSECIQRVKIVNRGLDRNVNKSLDMIRLPDSESWLTVNQFHLLEGREEHPASLAAGVHALMEAFDAKKDKAIRDILLCPNDPS